VSRRGRAIKTWRSRFKGRYRKLPIARKLKIVMTGAASDPADWQPHIGKRPKARRVANDVAA
jgi:hypothetical protein